ncbi:MAG TPA: hypothetical protein VEK39_10330 [Solirubrobacterales bacterium]|nr:hypothetical protein [Solirubrobacterales bacterium]
MPEPRGRLEGTLDALALDTSRRGFLARVGGALFAATAGGIVSRAIKPGEADAFHFCGHTFTTGSCPHPSGLPRIDVRGYPLGPGGQPIDNLGRPINDQGEPIDDGGQVKTDPDGRPLPPAPRTKVCEEVARRFGFNTSVDGSWFRCCGGTVRKLQDCCSYSKRRINGDASLEGYCFQGRRVFCVMFFQTKVPC